jgi:hypothetical protein
MYPWKTKKSTIAVGLVFAVFFIVGIFSMKSLQSGLGGSTMRLGIDLYPRWIGSEAVLNGQSPYNLETRQHIWQAIYGSTDQPDGNPFGFYYPPPIVTLLLPFILIGFSVNLAAILWCAFLWAIWSTVLFLWITQIPGSANQKSISFLFPLLLWISGLLFRPAFSNYILGQNSLFCVLMLVAAWISYQHKKDVLVGIFASLSLIKPSLTAIPIIFSMILYYRSYKGYLSFTLATILLYLPPTIMLGWWVPDFLNDISRYAVENSVSWSVGDIGTVSGITWLISSLLLILFGLLHKDKVLVLSSSLALNAVFVPHTADYDLVAFICLIFWLGNRWLYSKKCSLLLNSAFLMIILFPWISLFIFIQTGLPLSVENWYRFIWLVYPIMVLLSVLATRYLQGKNLFPANKQFQSFEA